MNDSPLFILSFNQYTWITFPFYLTRAHAHTQHNFILCHFQPISCTASILSFNFRLQNRCVWLGVSWSVSLIVFRFNLLHSLSVCSSLGQTCQYIRCWMNHVILFARLFTVKQFIWISYSPQMFIVFCRKLLRNWNLLECVEKSSLHLVPCIINAHRFVLIFVILCIYCSSITRKFYAVIYFKISCIEL